MNPMPPQQPMVSCGNCGSMNEPSRTSCRNCSKPMSFVFGSPEYLAARKAAIARIVAAAPPPTAEQIVKLRRIFASTAGRPAKDVRPAKEAA